MKRTFDPFNHKILDDFQPRNESQERALEVVTAYLKELEDNRTHGRGLIFLGPVGVGKTLLASIVLNMASLSGYRIEAIELDRYVDLIKDQFTLSGLMRELHEEEIADQLDKRREHIRYIRGATKRCADWVLFDDVGREYPSESGWSQNEFLDIVRGRWNRALPTILTTNLTMGELKERYTDSLTSVLMESSEVVLIEGDDYRCRRAS